MLACSVTSAALYAVSSAVTTPCSVLRLAATAVMAVAFVVSPVLIRPVSRVTSVVIVLVRVATAAVRSV